MAHIQAHFGIRLDNGSSNTSTRGSMAGLSPAPPLPLAARQFGHFHLAKPFEIDYSQQLRHPPRDIRPAPFAQLQAIADIARYRQVRPQGVALKYHGDIALLRRKMSDRSAGNSHLAALHRNKAAEGVQQRGFSASRRAQ